MLSTYRRYRLKIVNIVYWFLLVYIIAGLVRWYVVLDRQSAAITQYELGQVPRITDQAANDQAVRQVYDRARMRSFGYIGEGGTFLVVIVVGALFVGRVVARQMRLTDQQQNFMMAVTHELKTPISVAKLNLETLVKRKLTAEQQAKLIGGALAETDRLNRLTDNILLASRLEDSQYTPDRNTLAFSALLEQIVRSFAERFPARQLHADLQPGLSLNGDALLLELAVNNLIENALKYSPKEAPVRVELAQVRRELLVKVYDLGEGVPDGEKSRVFRKFYRIGKEQTRKTKGTGLGLYLTKTIIRKHHGQIHLQDNQPRGSVFTITFYT